LDELWVGEMKRWHVSYSERRIMEIIVEANDGEGAEQMVLDGDVDYDDAIEQDAEVIGVNSVTLYDE
jgi:hypothetical protein